MSATYVCRFCQGIHADLESGLAACLSSSYVSARYYCADCDRAYDVEAGIMRDTMVTPCCLAKFTPHPSAPCAAVCDYCLTGEDDEAAPVAIFEVYFQGEATDTFACMSHASSLLQRADLDLIMGEMNTVDLMGNADASDGGAWAIRNLSMGNLIP